MTKFKPPKAETSEEYGLFLLQLPAHAPIGHHYYGKQNAWHVKNCRAGRKPVVQVQMAPKDGKAILIFSLTQQKTLEEASQQTLKDLNLAVLNTKSTIVNKLPAIATVSKQVSQDQQTGQEQVIKVMSYFIQYNNAIYVFHGVAADVDFNSYFHIFESTMVNFDQLTENSKLNVKPKRIKVQTVQRSETLSDAFKYFGVPQNQINELTLLNNLELSDQVQKGKLIKLIGD